MSLRAFGETSRQTRRQRPHRRRNQRDDGWGRGDAEGFGPAPSGAQTWSLSESARVQRDRIDAPHGVPRSLLKSAHRCSRWMILGVSRRPRASWLLDVITPYRAPPLGTAKWPASLRSATRRGSRLPITTRRRDVASSEELALFQIPPDVFANVRDRSKERKRTDR